MKRVFLILCTILLTFAVKAEERSVEKAGLIAKEFFATQPMTKASAFDLRMVWDGSSPQTRSTSSVPSLYVFDNAAGPGFVIVSAEDKARTILGYSLDSELDADNLPPHFVSWMQEMTEQIEFVRTRSAEIQTRDDLDVGDVKKQLQTAKWNQGAPYNVYCPMDGAKRSVVGCVATAAAIVMRYHKWPAAGNGTVPAYTIESSGINVPENKLGAYNWDNMPLSFPKTGYSEEQANEVAKLMLDCGTMIKMSYSSSSSGAASSSLPKALQSYMDYDGACGSYQRGVYTTEQWHSMLEKELNENGPIVYSGHSDFGGHCFVLDGYTSKHYYSVNWGWSGSCDGWFSLDAMYPQDPGIGGSPDAYNHSQSAILNVKKQSGGEQEVRAVLGSKGDVKGLQADRDVFEPGVPFQLSTGLLTNVMTINYVGKMGFAVADKNDKVLEIVYQFDTNLKPGYGYYFTDREFSFNTELDFGHRLIAIIWDYHKNAWKKIPSNAEKDNPDFIPLYDQYTIEECTSFSFDTKTREVILSVKDGVTVALFNPAGEDISSSLTLQDKRAVINTRDLAAGKYRIELTKAEEFKALYFTVGSKE